MAKGGGFQKLVELVEGLQCQKLHILVFMAPKCFKSGA